MLRSSSHVNDSTLADHSAFCSKQRCSVATASFLFPIFLPFSLLHSTKLEFPQKTASHLHISQLRDILIPTNIVSRAASTPPKAKRTHCDCDEERLDDPQWQIAVMRPRLKTSRNTTSIGHHYLTVQAIHRYTQRTMTRQLLVTRQTLSGRLIC